MLEGKVYLAYTSTSMIIIKGSHDKKSNRVKTWRQELILKPYRCAAYWLTPHDYSACLLIEPRTNSPGIVSPTMSLPHPSLIGKVSYISISSGIFSLRLLSVMTLGCVKLTQTVQQSAHHIQWFESW